MVFQAVSFTESECGSKIKGQQPPQNRSKKRFCWTFKIDGVLNTIQLVSSFVSGKRKVLHNDREIYMEKELLNVKFEFTHKIDNHMIRLSQKQNKFQMVVDGLSFEKWQQNMGMKRESKKSSFKEEKSSNDPFADFGNLSKKTSNYEEHNAFGAFEDFSFPTKNQPKSSNSFSVKDNFEGYTLGFITGYSVDPNKHQVIRTSLEDLMTNPSSLRLKTPRLRRNRPKQLTYSIFDASFRTLLYDLLVFDVPC